MVEKYGLLKILVVLFVRNGDKIQDVFHLIVFGSIGKPWPVLLNSFQYFGPKILSYLPVFSSRFCLLALLP